MPTLRETPARSLLMAVRRTLDQGPATVFRVRGTVLHRKKDYLRKLHGGHSTVYRSILAAVMGSRPAWARDVPQPLLPLQDLKVYHRDRTVQDPTPPRGCFVLKGSS